MSLLDDFKKGIDVSLHPDTGTKAKMTSSDALMMYYKFSVIPVIISVLIVLILGSLIFHALQYTLFSWVTTIILVIFVAVYFWIMIPIGMLVIAVIYHVIGKILGFFKGSYSNTLTAVVYSNLLPAGVIWILIIPILGWLLMALIGLWSIYVLCMAFANQHKTTALKGFIVYVVPVILTVLLIAFLVVTSLFSVGD